MDSENIRYDRAETVWSDCTDIQAGLDFRCANRTCCVVNYTFKNISEDTHYENTPIHIFVYKILPPKLKIFS